MPVFQNPAAFLILLFIPMLYLFRKIGIFSRITFYTTLSDWNGKTFVWHRKFRNFASMFSRIAGILAFMCLVIAIARPVFYSQERVYTSRGSDLVFVLDVSPSMAAMDMDGRTRFEVAKESIKNLLSENTGASFGLVAIAGEASLVIPPTIDVNYFNRRLDEIDVGFLGDGTAIGTGICTAVYHLATSSAKKKCIVLITDGKNNSGSIHPETAAGVACRNNVSLYTLGIGSSGSAKMEYTDPVSGRYYAGSLSQSFDPVLMRSISEIGNGRFFEASSLKDLSLALSVISRTEDVVQSYYLKTKVRELYETFIFIASILTVICWAVRRIYLQEFI